MNSTIRRGMSAANALKNIKEVYVMNSLSFAKVAKKRQDFRHVNAIYPVRCVVYKGKGNIEQVLMEVKMYMRINKYLIIVLAFTDDVMKFLLKHCRYGVIELMGVEEDQVHWAEENKENEGNSCADQPSTSQAVPTPTRSASLPRDTTLKRRRQKIMNNGYISGNNTLSNSKRSRSLCSMSPPLRPLQTITRSMSTMSVSNVMFHMKSSIGINLEHVILSYFENTLEPEAITGILTGKRKKYEFYDDAVETLLRNIKRTSYMMENLSNCMPMGKAHTMCKYKTVTLTTKKFKKLLQV